MEKHKRLWREGITRERPWMKEIGLEQCLAELIDFFEEKFGDGLADGNYNAREMFAKTVHINLLRG